MVNDSNEVSEKFRIRRGERRRDMSGKNRSVASFPSLSLSLSPPLSSVGATVSFNFRESPLDHDRESREREKSPLPIKRICQLVCVPFFFFFFSSFFLITSLLYWPPLRGGKKRENYVLTRSKILNIHALFLRNFHELYIRICICL